jgi:DNA-directed RNA polymerase specialized sigma subunit
MNTDDINILKMYFSELNRDIKIDLTFDVLPLFKQIFKLEKQFSLILRSFKEGRNVYRDFCQYLLVEVADLREARSFFRERLSSFLPRINKAISRSTMKDVYKIHINYSFCVFVMKRLNTTNDEKVQKLKETMILMKDLRNKIINHHLYLALSQAKVFNGKNRTGVLEFSDFIQCANEALVVAVDKYVIDDNSPKFHKVAIGRMISHLLTLQVSHYSSATLGTHGQKKLHTLRKSLQNLSGTMKIHELSQVIKIAEQDITDLINATKYLSMDMPTSQDSDGLISEFINVEDNNAINPEELVEKQDLKKKMVEFYKTLDIIEQKLLLLKGVMTYGDYENNNNIKRYGRD